MERLSDSSIFQDLELVLLVFGNPFHIEAWAGAGGLATKSYLTLETPWTIARQASLSMRFPRHEYWRGLPFPSPGDLPGPGIEPASPVLQVVSCIAGGFFTYWTTRGSLWPQRWLRLGHFSSIMCSESHLGLSFVFCIHSLTYLWPCSAPFFWQFFFIIFFLLLVYLFSCVVFMAVHGIFVEVHSLSSYGVWTAKL